MWRPSVKSPRMQGSGDQGGNPTLHWCCPLFDLHSFTTLVWGSLLLLSIPILNQCYHLHLPTIYAQRNYSTLASLQHVFPPPIAVLNYYHFHWAISQTSTSLSTFRENNDHFLLSCDIFRNLPSSALLLISFYSLSVEKRVPTLVQG